MAPIRIFVMYPTQAGSLRTWHVSVDGKEGASYADGLVALQAACERARQLEKLGYEVVVRQEGPDGTWNTVRE